MERLLKFCRRSIVVASSFILLIACNNNSYPYYKKTFVKTEKSDLAKKLIAGRGWYYQGSPAEMLVFEEAKVLDSNNAKVYREIGVPYLKRGFPIEFFTLYQKSVELDPLNWQGWRGYLYLYFYRDYKRAISDLDATDTLTPNFVDYPQSLSVNFMRGIAYTQLGDLDKGLNYFTQHIDHEIDEFGPENIESNAFLFKAICHYKRGELKEAMEEINRAKAIDDISADVYYWKALVERDMDNIDIAKQTTEICKKLFNKGNYNSRSYVEEFFQIYIQDVIALENSLG